MRVRYVIILVLLICFIVSFSLSLHFYMKALNNNEQLADGKPISVPAYHFILIPEEMDNPYWRLVEDGAKVAGAKADVAVEYKGPAQANVEEHISAIDTAIATKVDGIITQGTVNPEMTAVINEAIQKGIPVITLDSDDPDSRRTAYIGTNNFKAGYQAGEALIKATHGEAEVGVVTGNFSSTNEKQRVAGFEEAVSKAPDVHIVDVEESYITRVQAAEKTYNMLIKYPKINAFFGTSALDGTGISAIIGQLDRKKDTYIIAFDALKETQTLIKKGSIDATVSQEPYQMGYQSVMMMLDILKGKQVKPLNYTDSQILRASDLDSPVTSTEVKHK